MAVWYTDKNKTGGILGVVLLFFVIVVQALATPPRDITLTYDAATQELTVDVDHISHNLRTHHIRKLEITVNGHPLDDRFFSYQTSPQGLHTTVPLEVAVGDTITVKAICSEAGYKEETLVVPSPEE